MSSKNPVNLTTQQKRIISGLKSTRNVLTKYKWTKGVLARDEKGERVGPSSKKACSFCAMGAVNRGVKNPALRGPIEDALDMQCEYELGKINIVHFNDNVARDKRSVIRLINRTIKSIETGNITLVDPVVVDPTLINKA